MTEGRRRIDVVLEPEYIAGLDERPDDDVRAMREECMELETEFSYVRRLAQARIEILTAEQERRANGGSVADLVAALPRILADSGPRPAPASSRLTHHLAPAPTIEWTRGRESLIADDTLVAYLLGEAERNGLEIIDDVDVVNVVEAHLAYFEAIGAVGPTATDGEVGDI